VTPFQFIVFCDYLKNHETVRISSFKFKISVPTYRKIVSRVMLILSKSEDFHSYLNKDFRFLDKSLTLPRIDGSFFQIFSLVDGFACLINRPQEDFRLYYSRKESDYCVRYQLWVSLSGRILDIFGPLPGTNNDINLLDQSNLLDNLLPNEYILCDGIYSSRNHTVTTLHSQNLPDGPIREMNQRLCALRAAVEQAIGRLRNFSYTRDRNRRYNSFYHSCCLRIIAIFLNCNQIYKDEI